MSDKNTGGPAFPWCGDLNECPTINLGMTMRQYAAIKLRVPESGTDWLDEMILKSQRDELAAKAMQGMCVESWPDEKDSKDIAFLAYQMADAMLEARK